MLKEDTRLNGGLTPLTFSEATAIDWENSPVTKEEYLDNPFEKVFDLQAKDGQEIPMFWVRFPSKREMLVAFKNAGVSVKKVGEEETVVPNDPIDPENSEQSQGFAMLSLFEELASICIADTDGIHNIPTPLKKRGARRVSVLTNEAFDAILNNFPDALSEIGQAILEGQNLTGEK